MILWTKFIVYSLTTKEFLVVASSPVFGVWWSQGNWIPPKYISLSLEMKEVERVVCFIFLRVHRCIWDHFLERKDKWQDEKNTDCRESILASCKLHDKWQWELPVFLYSGFEHICQNETVFFPLINTPTVTLLSCHSLQRERERERSLMFQVNRWLIL